MHVKCPTCGGTIGIDRNAVTPSGHMFFCPACGQELKAQQVDNIVKVMYGTLHGQRLIDVLQMEPASPGPAQPPSAAPSAPRKQAPPPEVSGLTRDHDSISLLQADDTPGDSGIELEDDPAPRARPMASRPGADGLARAGVAPRSAPRPPADRYGVEVTPSGTDDLIEDKDLKALELDIPPRPRPTTTRPPAGDIPITPVGDPDADRQGSLRRQTATAVRAQTEVTPLVDDRHHTPEPAGISRNRPTAYDQEVIFPARHEPIRVTSAFNDPRSLRQRRDREDLRQFLKILAAGISLSLAIVAAGYVLWSRNPGITDIAAPPAAQIASYPDYEALVKELKERYPQVQGTVENYVEQGLASLYADEDATYQEAQESFSRALALDPGDPLAIFGFVVGRLWLSEAGLNLTRIKAYNDGIDYGQARHGQKPLLLMARSLSLHRIGQWQDGRDLLDEACAMQEAREQECAILKGVMGLELEPHRVLVALTPLLTDDSRLPVVYRLLGEAYLGVNQFGKSERMLTRRLAITPGHPATAMALADLYGSVGLYDKALDQLALMARQEDFRVAAAIRSAEIVRGANLDPTKVLPLFDTILESGFGRADDAMRSRALTEYSLLLYASGQNQKALDTIRRSRIHLEDDALRIVLTYCSGMYSVNVGDSYDGFKKALEELGDQFNQDPWFRFVASFAKYDFGLIKEATLDYQQLPKLGMDPAVINLAYSLIYIESNNPNEALRLLKTLLNSDPLDALFSSAQSIFPAPNRMWQRLNEAMYSEDLLMRENQAPFLYRGLAAFHLRRYGDAAQILGDYWRNQPPTGMSKVVSVPLTVSLIKTGQYKKARAVLARQLEMTPLHAPSMLLEGYIEELSGNESRALAIYQRVHNQEPGDPLPFLLAARSLLEQDRTMPRMDLRIRELEQTMGDNLLWRQCAYLLERYEMKQAGDLDETSGDEARP